MLIDISNVSMLILAIVCSLLLSVYW